MQNSQINIEHLSFSTKRPARTITITITTKNNNNNNKKRKTTNDYLVFDLIIIRLVSLYNVYENATRVRERSSIIKEHKGRMSDQKCLNCL